ncbi:MAG: LpxL/LpxP family Kdo(2)-lipid IV(A) lauroyl/palmitoleoyl acyltransferase [Gammaproteobacteria bacterium]
MNKRLIKLASPRYWPAWLGLSLLWLITRLPYQWQINIGESLGKAICLFPTKFKHITETNIKLCYPDLSDKERSLLVRKNFASIGVGLIEAGMAWWLPDSKLNCLYKIHGLEHVEAAFARGKGIILLGPHFTCLEMIGRLLGMQYAFAVMYRPHKKALISFIHERFRKKNSVQYIARHRIRELLRALNNNKAIWYAYDVDGGKKRSVFAPFFGIKTASLTAVTRIVKLSDASVVPISFYRRDNELGYDIFLSAPLENFPGSNLEEDATRLNAAIELAIRNKPEQYVWQYKRFKTRPQGEPRFY